MKDKPSKFEKELARKIHAAVMDYELATDLAEDVLKAVRHRLHIGVHTFGIEAYDLDQKESLAHRNFIDSVEEAVKSELEDCVCENPKHYAKLSRKFKEWSSQIDKVLAKK